MRPSVSLIRLITLSSLAALIGEENLPNLSDLVLLLQEREESLEEGFTVVFKEQVFNFVPEFVDR